MSDSRKNVRPCIHGEVCRAYMREFGMQQVDGRLQDCIISVDCPKCRYYEPASSIGAGGNLGNTVMQPLLLLA